MHRRAYLRGVIVGTGAVLAGCSDEGDQSDDEPTLAPAESEEFAEHLKPHTDDALAALEESVGMFTTETAKFDTFEPGAIDVEIEPISTRLSDANSAIGNASNAPYSYRFQHYTRGLRQFRDWLMRFVPLLEAAQSAAEAWTAGIATWQDGEFETAADTVGGVSQAPLPEHVPAAWEPGDDLVAYAENFDVDIFERMRGWAGDVETAFIALGEWGVTIKRGGYGLRTVWLAFDSYLRSIQRYEERQWQRDTNHAATSAAAAQSRFQEAATSLRDNAERIPGRFESDYNEILCYAESMVEAAQLRREAALAAEAGDRGTAAEKIAAAQQARDRCPPA